MPHRRPGLRRTHGDAVDCCRPSLVLPLSGMGTLVSREEPQLAGMDNIAYCDRLLRRQPDNTRRGVTLA